MTTGHIRKRPEHRRAPYKAVLDLGVVDGRRRRREKSFRTEREAKAWLASEASKRHSPGAGTVGALLAAWYEWGVAVRGWSPSHAERTAGIINRDLAPLHRLRADALTVTDIEALLAARKRAGLAPNSLKKLRDSLSGAYQLAIRRGEYRGENVARRVPAPEVPPHAPDYLTPEQARRAVEVLDGDRHGALYLLQLALALRPSEVLGLEWGDLSGNVLTVRRGVTKVREEWHVVRPKHGSARTLYVPDAILARLEAHRQQQQEEHLRLGVRTPLMFTSRRGGYLNQAHLSRRLGRILGRAGLPRITQYQLRHTGATLMLALGVPLEQIRDVLGHRTLDMTLRYARTMERQRASVAVTVDGWLGGYGGSGGGNGDEQAGQQRSPTG